MNTTMLKTMPKETLRKINEILLRRKNAVYIPFNGIDEEPLENIKQIILTMNANLSSYGYTLSDKFLTKLLAEDSIYPMSITTVEYLYDSLVYALDKLTGNDAVYNPMYPNFPKQVMEMDTLELYLNAIVHYLSWGTWLPEYEKETRLPLPKGELKPINIGTLKDLYDITMNLLSSPTSLSEQDKEDIKTYIDIADGRYVQSPIYIDFNKIIVFKETRAFLQKVLLDKNAEFYKYPVLSMNNTITDVLRMAVAMSDGDVSLSEVTKFKKFSRPERRLILESIDHIIRSAISMRLSPSNSNYTPVEIFNEAMDSHKIDYIVEEMFLHRMQFIRLGEIIHPGSEKYKRQFPFAACIYDVLRNETVTTYYGKVDAAIQEGDVTKITSLLSQRPGEFARRLDMLLRNELLDSSKVISSFNKVADKVSTNVLYQVLAHFTSIGSDKEYYNKPRIFFPKGQIARAYVRDNDVQPIDLRYVYQIINICNNAILKTYMERDYMGMVYVNKEFKNYMMPFSQRSASDSSRMLTRGSRISMGDDVNVIRAFVHWTNTKNSRVDLDLSATLYDENFEYISHVSYTNLRAGLDKEYYAVHSGDITNGGPADGPGVAEFIDFDITKMSREIEKGARYIVFQVYSYTGQPFTELPVASFGWMQRTDAMIGKVFEPSTVENRIRINQNSTKAIPVIFDLIERQFIWTDLSGDASRSIGGRNLESNMRGTTLMLYAMVNLKKTTMFDVITKNIKARGLEVDNKEDADIIFDLEKGEDETKKYITPYDVDEIVALL